MLIFPPGSWLLSYRESVGVLGNLLVKTNKKSDFKCNALALRHIILTLVCQLTATISFLLFIMYLPKHFSSVLSEKATFL